MKTNATERTQRRTYPFNLLPDWYWATISVIYLSCTLPTLIFLAIALILGEGFRQLVSLARKVELPIVHSAYNKYLVIRDKIAELTLTDPRNASFLFPCFYVTIFIPTMFIISLYRYKNYGWEWGIFILYHALRVGPRYTCFTWNHVLVHREAHDHAGIWKWKWWPLKYFINYSSGIFYGVMPGSYHISHLKIHHQFDNGFKDVHTNCDLDRSDPFSFLIYIPRFAMYWVSLSPLLFFLQSKHFSARYIITIVTGISYYLFACFVVYTITDATFFIYYFLLPLPEAILFLSGISYMWHIFASPEDPDDPYVSSITILNGRDNYWNEDYHVAHHATNIHWSEYEDHYKNNIIEFEKRNASIFKDTEEGELLVLILTKNWDKLTELFVDLSGRLSFEEKKKLLLRRLQYVHAADINY